MAQATVSVDRHPDGQWHVQVVGTDGRTWTYIAVTHRDAEECVCAAIRGLNYEAIKEASERASTLPR